MGLAFEARRVGRLSNEKCPNCGSEKGAKLTDETLSDLANRFFIHGSLLRADYGGATVLRFGDGNVAFPAWLEPDIRLFRERFGIAFRTHGPRTWRIGEIVPLYKLQEESTRAAAVEDAIQRFPRRFLAAGEAFYRLRKGVETGNESKANQYDAPPQGCGRGRLDSAELSVLYGSQDIEICIHECRATVADICHIATLKATKQLQLLNLCGPVYNDGQTPFESLRLAIDYVFSAETYSYEITRAIARAAKAAGFHGVVYPSYFRDLRGDEIPNIGLFGHPVAKGIVELICANRLLLHSARYTFALGPCLRLDSWWA
jgi:hypothetical protein